MEPQVPQVRRVGEKVTRAMLPGRAGWVQWRDEDVMVITQLRSETPGGGRQLCATIYDELGGPDAFDFDADGQIHIYRNGVEVARSVLLNAEVAEWLRQVVPTFGMVER